jgi:hypothetical protein
VQISPHLTKLLILTLLAVYFVAGLSLVLPQVRSIYPVNSWFLFYKVPNDKLEFMARVISLQGKALNSPTFLTDVPGLLPQTETGIYYHHLVRKLALSLESSDKTEILTARQLLEKNFQITPLTYQLVKVKYNVPDYLKTGRVDLDSVLATFEVP